MRFLTLQILMIWLFFYSFNSMAEDLTPCSKASAVGQVFIQVSANSKATINDTELTEDSLHRVVTFLMETCESLEATILAEKIASQKDIYSVIELLKKYNVTIGSVDK